WAKGWEASPLVGLILLLGLSPDGDLARRCARVVLTYKNLKPSVSALGSFPYIVELAEAAMSGAAKEGDLQQLLGRRSDGRPIVVMTPHDGDLTGLVKDEISHRHFFSVIKQLEQAAAASKASLTLFDATKAPDVRLSRGVLVTRSSQRGGTLSAKQGLTPAEMNMDLGTWESFLSASKQGNW
ncbi:unnamed protein product, partial [Discosporangium mesarthrocarpum]